MGKNLLEVSFLRSDLYPGSPELLLCLLNVSLSNKIYVDAWRKNVQCLMDGSKTPEWRSIESLVFLPHSGDVLRIYFIVIQSEK